MGGCGAVAPGSAVDVPVDGRPSGGQIDYAELAKAHDIQVTEVSPGTYDFLIVRTDGQPVEDYRFIWHFGGLVNDTREGVTVRYPFPVEGDYEVIVSAFSPELGEAARTQERVAFALELSMRVPAFGHYPPIARAGSDFTALAGEHVCLDASASFDPNGDDISYAWWQVSGAPVVMQAQTDPKVVCFAAPAVSKTSNLVFALRTSDDTGNTEDRITVTVLAPVAAEAFAADAGSDQTVTPGTLVTLRGSAQGASGAEAPTFQWSQVNGQDVELDATDAAEVHFTAPETLQATELLAFDLAVTQNGRSAHDTVQVILQNDKLVPAAATYFEGFDELGPGDNPAGWVDTEADNSMTRSDSLFTVVDSGGDLAFGTSSSSVNIHTHYTGDDAANWTNYVLTGRMMLDDYNGGLGVTFFSDYPNSDSYYRLRSGSFPGGEMFHIAPHGTTITGDTSTDVRPTPGVWYKFRISVTDTGDATQIYANVWPEGDTEPAGWQVDCYDDSASRLTQGTMGLWSMGSGDKYWDDLSVEAEITNDGPIPDDPCLADSDFDGVGDCDDQCPFDANKSEPGVCGCNVPDQDLNQNGTVDCIESSAHLSVSQTSLNFGVGVNSVSFDVWNSGTGSLSYSISDNASWLTLSPTSGTSAGERDTVTATVNRSGLNGDSYSAEVTVTPSIGAPITLVVTLLISAPSGPTLTPAARWDTVPYQRIESGDTLKAGVVAFSKNGIQEVRFNISGQGYSGANPKVATSMTYNDQHDVWEYWVPISASEFTSDGQVTVEATVVGNDGGIRDKNTTPGNGLEALTLYVNPRGSLPRNVAWVDSSSGSDSQALSSISRSS
ncbi:MAG TPA: hypothetical protein P5572_19690, partial [Phycisphaerae bacterium]|nr:hypothetical protein [Phycisphaerae bacterium]